MGNRDVVFAVFLLNLIIGFALASLSGWSVENVYALLMSFLTVALAYWIMKDGDDIELLKRKLLEKKVLNKEDLS